MDKNKEYPKSFSHIGITVPDLKKAVEFYSEVMELMKHRNLIRLIQDYFIFVFKTQI